MPLTIRHGEASEEERERVIELLKRVGLGDQINKRPDEMIGGRTSVAPSCGRWPMMRGKSV